MTHLDNTAGTALSRPQNDSADSLASLPMSCGSRWHCVWTHPQREHAALYDIGRKGIETVLLLHAERSGRIVPLFSRYLFVRFDPNADQWRRIYRSNGVGGLICHAPERPTPLPPGVVEHLLARTSQRGVVDDPGCAPRQDIPLGASVSLVGGAFDGLAGVVALSGPERCRVLLSLFAATVPISVPTASLRVVA